jgi:prevent-host-death family protein
MEAPMERAVSAAEANRRFRKLLRNVRKGQSYVVTAQGRPVARIVPVVQPNAVTDCAKRALLKRLKAQKVITIGCWRREELYDDEA